MSADADELFERADRAIERNTPTLDELKCDLAEALDELEDRFPRGRPPRGDNWKRLQYRTLLLRIGTSRTAIEHGFYSEPEPVNAEWQQFLESHPELVAAPTFTDDEILAALRAAIASRTQPWLQGAADSSCVVAELIPGKWSPTIASRTGKHLARLAREGRVVRFRRKWTKGRGSSIWSLPGIEVNEWWLKQYEVDHA